MRDLDNVNPAALSLITGSEETAKQMFELLRTNKGQNTTKIIELYNKAINSGQMMRGMKNMDQFTSAEMSKQLGISDKTFNNLASIEAGTFDNKVYKELQNINDNTSDWLKVSKENNFLTDNQLGKVLLNWANKFGLGDVFIKFGKILNDPTWGGLFTGIASFTAASVVPKILGGTGRLLKGGLTGLFKLPGLIGKGGSFLGKGLSGQGAVAGVGAAGKLVKFGGGAIGVATSLFDGVTAAMNPTSMGMRDDGTSRVSAGVGAALGGKGKGFGGGLVEGFMGAASGALKGAAIGSNVS